MPTHASEQGLGESARRVAEHASALARLELELAALELKRKALNLGLGIGLGVGALVFGLFALAFGLATLAAVIAIWLEPWIALIIMFGFMGFLTLVLALLAVSRIARGTPPVPKQAIEEARLTTEALRSDGHT